MLLAYQMMENNLTYESPFIEVIEVVVEQGFATSNATGNTTPWEETTGNW